MKKTLKKMVDMTMKILKRYSKAKQIKIKKCLIQSKNLKHLV